MSRFYRYEGPNEQRADVVLTVDLSVVIPMHEMRDDVYLETDAGINWTMRRDRVDVEALRAQWMQARAGETVAEPPSTPEPTGRKPYVHATAEAVLDYIAHHGGASRREIAHALNVSRSSIGRILAVLCENGMIRSSGHGPACAWWRA